LYYALDISNLDGKSAPENLMIQHALSFRGQMLLCSY